jgi:toxin-antitoxin system PIN domain toxin
MLSMDTNVLLYSQVEDSPFCEASIQFLNELSDSPDVVVAELVLVELYGLLRNPAVMTDPLSAPAAVSQCDQFRRHPRWQLVENAPVMRDVWRDAAAPGFPRRRIFDVRLARTLMAHGVTEFATANVRDFEGLGFKRVWNPLIGGKLK